MRPHLTYANVMATTAVFIALGGTSYAVTALPRNSVGAKQIRANAVGASELRADAVRSKDIKRRAISLEDLSLSARSSLRGQAGPAGPQGPPGPTLTPYTAAVDAAGTTRSTTALTQATHDPGSGKYEVVFNRDMRSCFAVATPSRFQDNGQPGPEAAQISTETMFRGVIVRTRNESGAVADVPFHLIVVC